MSGMDRVAVMATFKKKRSREVTVKVEPDQIRQSFQRAGPELGGGGGFRALGF